MYRSNNKVNLGAIVNIRTGKLDANAASLSGTYPFFTCSKEIQLIEYFDYDCECVLVAGNGDLNVKYYKGKFNAYQRTYIIESKDKGELSNRYLFYFMDKYVEVLRKQSLGGVIKYIKLENLTSAVINLADSKEQDKIVKELDLLSTLIENSKLRIMMLDLLIKSRFNEMFGNIDKTKWKELFSLCLKITDGTHQSPKFVRSGIPFIFVSNIVDNEIKLDTEKYITEKDYNELIKRTPIDIGDLLVSTVGSYGHVAIVNTNAKFCFQRHIAYLKVDTNKCNSIYVRSALLSNSVKSYMDSKVNGVAQKTLNLKDLKRIKIPDAPIELQNKFANFVKHVEQNKSKIKNSLDKLITLKKALMQKYFG